MTTILLLRGINVGGHNRLPMAALRDHLAALGADQPRTYLQSGNAVFGGEVQASDLADRIAAKHGFRPALVMRDAAAWARMVAGQPFPEVDDPKALHVIVFDGAAAVDEGTLISAAGPEERLSLRPGCLYLHTPKYLSGSKLAPRVDRLLGQPTTARNWRTVMALHDMAAG